MAMLDWLLPSIACSAAIGVPLTCKRNQNPAKPCGLL